MHRDVRALLDRQDDVISRRQALATGLQPHDIRRLLRRREWVQVHRGVYVAHTGALSWIQRAWAAVLWAWPAALWGESALRAAERAELPAASDGDVIHLVIDHHRSGLQAPPGVDIRHSRHLDAHVHGTLGYQGRASRRPRSTLHLPLAQISMPSRCSLVVSNDGGQHRCASSARSKAENGYLVGDGCAQSYATLRTAPVRCWSTASSRASNDRTGSRVPIGSDRSGLPEVSSTATRTSGRCWSSLTDACSTSRSSLVTQTSSATSMSRRMVAEPSGSAGDRCSTDHAPRPPSS